MIGLQNFPGGFNAFREMVSPTRMRGLDVLRFYFLLSLLGPLAAAISLAFFVGQPVLLGLVMVFAGRKHLSDQAEQNPRYRTERLRAPILERYSRCDVLED